MLNELRDILDSKWIKVGRFVRVTFPARGTTLASERLDRWLSVLDFISGQGFFGDAVDFFDRGQRTHGSPARFPGWKR